jgi:triosephosphate isomerase
VSKPRPIIAGNWKMNGLRTGLEEVRILGAAIAAHPPAARVVVCPPATLLAQAAAQLDGLPIEVGAQDCHSEACGAYTGDLSAEMLVDAGAAVVILGHSERRDGHQESDDLVASKVAAAVRAGLEPIVCVGETLEQRRAGAAARVVEAQLRGSLPAALAGRPFAVAYEPVWAIGAGVAATSVEIEDMHCAIRRLLTDMFGEQGRLTPILYGGSVKPENAAAILRLAEVNGALVGGASLKASDFVCICQAL